MNLPSTPHNQSVRSTTSAVRPLLRARGNQVFCRGVHLSLYFHNTACPWQASSAECPQKVDFLSGGTFVGALIIARARGKIVRKEIFLTSPLINSSTHSVATAYNLCYAIPAMISSQGPRTAWRGQKAKKKRKICNRLCHGYLTICYTSIFKRTLI